MLKKLTVWKLGQLAGCKVSILKPQYTDLCFMEVHSSNIFLSYYRSSGLPYGIMTGFTDVNFPRKSSCYRQSLPDENFRNLITNGKLRISLFFRQVCLAEMHCDLRWPKWLTFHFHTTSQFRIPKFTLRISEFGIVKYM